jgi:hypothetical protein
VLANAEDVVLDETAGFFGDADMLKALRFTCGAFLTLRQAKRLADVLAGVDDG